MKKKLTRCLPMIKLCVPIALMVVGTFTKVEIRI